MAESCPHENTRTVMDMPIADPVTFEFEGRFDVVFCSDCETVLTKKLTTYPQPEEASQA